MPWTVVLEKTPETPLDSKEIKPVNLKGNQFWKLTGRIVAEAKTPIFWSPNMNGWLIGKISNAGKDWGQKEKRTSEDEMAWWSPMQWTWTWAHFGKWWGIGRPGTLQTMGSQRIRRDWATEQQKCWIIFKFSSPNDAAKDLWVPGLVHHSNSMK